MILLWRVLIKRAIFETVSTQSLDVKLWRTYKSGDEFRHFAERQIIPTELEWRFDLYRFRIKSGMTRRAGY